MRVAGKDEVPLHHDGVRGVAGICAAPKRHCMVAGHFLRVTRRTSAVNCLFLRRDRILYCYMACVRKRHSKIVDSHLQKVCHRHDGCLLIGPHFVAPNAVLLQKGCAIIRQASSGAGLLRLSMRELAIQERTDGWFLCHCGARAAADAAKCAMELLMTDLALDALPR